MPEFNIYDISECRKAIDALKGFPADCRAKSEHRSKVQELLGIIEAYCAPLNSAYFNNTVAFHEYKQAVNVFYYERTKDQLDRSLKLAIHKLIVDIEDCISIEYKTQDGRLVPHPTRNGSWIDKKEEPPELRPSVLEQVRAGTTQPVAKTQAAGKTKGGPER